MTAPEWAVWWPPGPYPKWRIVVRDSKMRVIPYIVYAPNFSEAKCVAGEEHEKLFNDDNTICVEWEKLT